MAAEHPNLIAYLRVSSEAQDTQLQRDALTEAGCVKFFEDKISSRKTDRPGLGAALEYLRSGDTLAVWKLDRLGRSVKEVLTFADELYERGIGLRILTGTLAGSYTPTGEGKFFFTIMAAFAELERDMIHQRTMAGPPRRRSLRSVVLWSSVRFSGRLSSAQRAPLNFLAAAWSGSARSSLRVTRRTVSRASVTSLTPVERVDTDHRLGAWPNATSFRWVGGV